MAPLWDWLVLILGISLASLATGRWVQGRAMLPVEAVAPRSPDAGNDALARRHARAKRFDPPCAEVPT